MAPPASRLWARTPPGPGAAGRYARRTSEPRSRPWLTLHPGPWVGEVAAQATGDVR